MVNHPSWSKLHRDTGTQCSWCPDMDPSQSPVLLHLVTGQVQVPKLQSSARMMSLEQQPHAGLSIMLESWGCSRGCSCASPELCPAGRGHSEPGSALQVPVLGLQLLSSSPAVAEGHGLSCCRGNNGEEGFDSSSDGHPPAPGWCRWKELGARLFAFILC